MGAPSIHLYVYRWTHRVLLIYSAKLNDISPPQEIPASVFRQANRVYPRNVCTRFETRWNQPPIQHVCVRVRVRVRASRQR